MRRHWAWIIALCCTSGPAAAAPALTLQQAVALALRHNPELAEAKAELAAAAGAQLAARGLDDAVLSASAAYRLQRANLTALQGPPRSDQVTAVLQLEQPLPSGGRLALGLDTSYLRGPGAALPLPSAGGAYTQALQLSLEQPLLRGSGAAVARAEQRRASFGRELARSQIASAATALLRDVVSGYWRLAHARSELEIRRASAAAARAQLERVQANIAAGKLPPSAAAEIEVAIALREDAVLLAEQTLTERGLGLGSLCGMPRAERLEPAEPLPSAGTRAAPPPGLHVALNAALAHSPELQELRARGRAALVEREVSEDGLLPRLDLALGGGPAASAASAQGALEQLGGLGGYALFASLSLELPLARRAARGALQQAHARARRLQLAEANVASQLRLAVASSLALLETARRRAAALAPSQRLAALDLEAEQARFDVGRASSFDVLRRQDALVAVQQLLLGAELQRLEAEAALGALTGELLASHASALGAGPT